METASLASFIVTGMMIIMLVVVCGDEDNDDHYPGVYWDVDDENGVFGDGDNGNRFSVIYMCTAQLHTVD